MLAKISLQTECPFRKLKKGYVKATDPQKEQTYTYTLCFYIEQGKNLHLHTEAVNRGKNVP